MASPSLFRHAVFLTSVRELRNLPPEGHGEIAFAGRSNAGKSSALNTLTDHRGLAFVSKTPGRTQLINYFDLGEQRYLVDLPGYGYAKVPEAIRAPWGRDIGDYLLTRQSLRGLALIVDVRHELSDLDRALLAWFRPTQKPVHVLLTKADKLSRSDASGVLAAVRKALSGMAGNYSAQLYSSLKRSGISEAEQALAGWLGLGYASDPVSALKELAPDRKGKRRTGVPRNKKAPG